jgi:methyltransferase (TIGR00027 family)
MKPGQASQTAVLVAMARARAHLRATEPRFADPTALALLPPEPRAAVERASAGTPPRDARERATRAFLERRGDMVVVRTVAIDDAIRAAAAPQVVILGAGLDGRAWRMPELRDVVVFEVDHPDSQRDKRARVAALPAVARDVRFVAVDFTRDDLGAALAAAGHDPARPTTWVWEGVVMYLSPEEVEATLAVVAARSAPGSRLVVLYLAPWWIARIVGLIVRRLGEPFRSKFTAAEFAALLGRHGFAVVADDDVPALARGISRALARSTRAMHHIRIAVATRRAT